MRDIWTYPASYMVGNHDADTITVNIDLGQQQWTMGRNVRLFGVAANELKDPGGKEARDAVSAKIPIGTKLYIISRGWDKYAGRIDGVVYLDPDQAITLQSWLILEGWAVPWDGNGKQPKVPWPRVRPEEPERVW